MADLAAVPSLLQATTACSTLVWLVGCSTSTPTEPKAALPPAERPASVQAAGSATLSDDEVRTLVRAHNIARADVGTSPLSWSATIAATAEAWAGELAARGCDLQHSTGGPYGENLYWSSGPQRAQNVVASWTDEAAHFNARRNACARGQVCGHYTQVVWTNTTAVGCAMASCGSAQVWVCNYDPPGNFVGEKPF